MIIAIDGPAAAGKGTLARRLAEHLELAYLDTGALYRAVGVSVLACGGDPETEADALAAVRRLDSKHLADPSLRTETAGAAASKVAAIPSVRAALLDFQRRFAAHPPQGCKGAVLDGRDIGTVVCPDADRKLFITASLEKRAERRFKELREKGREIIEEQVWQDMQQRDGRDSTRSVAPLAAADDAVVIDTSDLDADAVFEVALNCIVRRT